MNKRALIFASACSAVFLPFCAFATQYPSSGEGTVELTVTPLVQKQFYDNQVLFQASSSDGKEFYEIQVVGGDLLVIREFGKCIRSANRMAHDFKAGESYRLELAWNGPSTCFYINYKPFPSFNLLVSNDSFTRSQFLKAGGSADFAVSGLAINPESDIAINAQDRSFVNNCRCPQLAQMLDDRPQEEYRGVGLHHFPDQATRDRVKADIDILPPPVAACIKHIIFVDAADRMAGAQGLTTSGNTFYLRTGFSTETFFHEATHIWDINSNYVKSRDWGALFMKDSGRGNASVLSYLDGSTGQEQLAQFSGSVYDFYLANRHPAELAAKFGPRTQGQLEFLLQNGFITKDIYARLTGGG
jgi:hypothetical protein